MIFKYHFTQLLYERKRNPETQLDLAVFRDFFHTIFSIGLLFASPIL